VDAELVSVLQDIRDHFGNPLLINSGFRCESHNKKIGGAKRSTHLQGRGADFVVAGVSCDDVYCYLVWKYPDVYGIKNYGNWIHLDTRSGGKWRG
jgi:uncharacterized protein YcbK (DUF882 family)